VTAGTAESAAVTVKAPCADVVTVTVAEPSGPTVAVAGPEMPAGKVSSTVEPGLKPPSVMDTGVPAATLAGSIATVGVVTATVAVAVSPSWVAVMRWLPAAVPGAVVTGTSASPSAFTVTVPWTTTFGLEEVNVTAEPGVNPMSRKVAGVPAATRIGSTSAVGVVTSRGSEVARDPVAVAVSVAVKVTPVPGMMPVTMTMAFPEASVVAVPGTEATAGFEEVRVTEVLGGKPARLRTVVSPSPMLSIARSAVGAAVTVS